VIQNVGENGFDVVVGVPFVTTIVGQEGDDESFPGFGGTEEFGWHFGVGGGGGTVEGWELGCCQLLFLDNRRFLLLRKEWFFYNNKYDFLELLVNNFTRKPAKGLPELL